MIKIMSLSFEESARLERILNKNDIPYNWDFSADWLGCIDKCYDLELLDEYITIEYCFGFLEITVWKELKEIEIAAPHKERIVSIKIPRCNYKEVILS